MVSNAFTPSFTLDTNALHACVIEIDFSAKILALSPQWEAQFSLPPQKAIGQSLFSYLTSDSKKRLSAALENANRSLSPESESEIHPTINQTPLFECALQLLPDDCRESSEFILYGFRHPVNANAQTVVAEARTLDFFKNTTQTLYFELAQQTFATQSQQLQCLLLQARDQANTISEYIKEVERVFKQFPQIEQFHHQQLIQSSPLSKKVGLTLAKSESIPNHTSKTVQHFATFHHKIHIQLAHPTEDYSHFEFQLSLNCFDFLIDNWLVSLEQIFETIHTNLLNLTQTNELLNKRRQLTTLVEKVNVIGFEIQLENQCFDYVSPRVYDILGYQPEDWRCTQQWLALVHHEDRLHLRSFLHKPNDRSTREHLSFRMRHHKGYFVWFNAYFNYEQSHTNQNRMHGLMIDISDQKQIQESLEKANLDIAQLTNEQHILLSLLDMGDIVFFKWRNNLNWSIDYVSLSVEKLLGYSPEAFTEEGKLYGNCIHPHDLQKVMDEVSNAIKSNQNFFKHQPYRIVDKYNQVKWVSDITYIARDEHHNIINFVGYVFEMTNTEDAHKQLQCVMNLSDSLMVITNGNRIQHGNQYFLDFFQYSTIQAFLKNHTCVCDLFVNYPGHYSKSYESSHWIRELEQLPAEKRLVALKRQDATIGSFLVKISKISDVNFLVNFSESTQKVSLPKEPLIESN